MLLLISNYAYIIRHLDRKVNLFSQEKTLAEQGFRIFFNFFLIKVCDQPVYYQSFAWL